jgi:Kef-type K+ transport system membrane component KefB
MLHPLLATAPTEVMLAVLIQLIVILLAARVFGGLAQWLKQPVVVGEIIGGILLGPSLFKAMAPELWASVFQPQAVPIFNILKELGLVLLLFLVGMEFDFKHLRQMGKASLLISLTGIVLPCLLGILLAQLLIQVLPMQVEGYLSLFGMPIPIQYTIDPFHFTLFMATSMSITALPVLGRIMMELNITRTRLGAVTITAAAVDDACAWIILATVAGIVKAGQHGEGFDFWLTLRMIGLTLGFLALMVLVVRPVLSKVIRAYFQKTGGELGPTGLAVLLCILFLCAIATERIGIFAIFGAFILGASLSAEHQLHEAVSKQMRTFVVAFFLPIFFTFTGLRTDIGGLGGLVPWAMCLLVLLTAVGGKFGGCYFTARWTGFPPREAGCIAIMMNARALMELIVINVGLDLKVITPEIFTMLVLMAVTTTIMTTPVLLRLYRGTELEPFIDATSFGKGGRLSVATRRGESHPAPEPANDLKA